MLKKPTAMTVLLCMSAVALVTLMVGTAIAAGLQATITLNGAQFTIGDTVSASYNLVNDNTRKRVRAESWLEFLGGNRVSLDSNNMTIKPNENKTVPLYEQTFTAQDDVGHYIIGIDIIDRKTGALIASDMKEYMFVINPDGDCIQCHAPDPPLP